MADDAFQVPDAMGFDVADQAPPAAAPIEEDRATRARGGADNFFSAYVKGDEKTYGETSNLQRAKDVGTAGFYKGTLLGAAEANNQAHPATTGQEMFGLDPRAGLTPDEQRYAQHQEIMRAYEDYARSRTNENNVDVTDAQLAQIRSALYPDATNIGTAAADVAGGLVGGALSPEVAFAPEVRAAEAVGLVARPAVGVAVDAAQVAGTSGREALARYLNSGVSAAAANTAINPATQALGTAAGLQPSFDPLQAAEAPVTGFMGGVLLHGAGEGIGYAFGAARNLVNRVRGRADGGAPQQAAADLAADSPAFRPQSTGGPETAPLPPQPAAETSAQVAEGATPSVSGTSTTTPAAPADTTTPATGSAPAERPAPVSVPVASFDRAGILAAYGDGQGGIDMDAASQAIGQQVEAALGEGKTVTYRIENKEVPIVAVEGGRLKDAEGQTWGLQQVLQPRPGDANRIDITEKPGTPQTPQDGSGTASAQVPATTADRTGNAVSESRSEATRPMQPAEIAADVSGALRGGEIDAKRFSAPPTVEELDRIIEGGRAHDEAEADRVFGADAAEAKRLMRSSSDAAHDKLADLVERHGPEAEAVVYGMHGRGVVVDEDMRALRDRIGDMDSAVDQAAERGDTADLAREMAWLAPKLPDIAADAASHTSEQRIAVLTLARAVEDMRAKGIDPEPVLRGAVSYTVQRTRGDGDDAEVLLGRLAGYAKEYMRAPAGVAPAAPALPAPTVAALSAPNRLPAPPRGATIAENGPLGPVVRGLKGRWADAVAWLQSARTGDARGVLEHPDVPGPIDVVWGNDRGGLQHIMEKHPEVVADLPQRLAAMRAVSSSANRIILASPDTRAVLRLTYDGQAKTWLVTAYGPEELANRRAEGTTGRSDIAGTDTHPPSPPAPDNIAPDGAERHVLRGDLVPGMQPHRVATPDGRGVEVAPIVVEARDLRTSADPGYDATLQPRDRDRAASQAQIRDIATNLDPDRLGFSAEADRGAPIIGADGSVESGNGRVLALRSVYDQGGEAATRYKEWLAGQGVDVARYDQPVLVRQRLTDLSPEDRQAFTVSANQAATLSMSASERALADSLILTPSRLDLLRNADDLGAAANAEFRRAFVGALPASERGAMTAADGAVSAEGLTRIRNAVLAAAYGDSPVLGRIAEATHDEVRSISNALTAAAPAWARLKADIAEGRVPSDFDLRADLLEAVQRTADLRAKGTKLADAMAQQDAFDPIRDPVAAFMRMFYHADERKAAGQQRITDALRYYAEEARKVSAERGLDLGLTPVRPEDIQGAARERANRQGGTGSAGGQETLFLRRSGDGARGVEAGGRLRGRGLADERGAGAQAGGERNRSGSGTDAAGGRNPDDVRFRGQNPPRNLGPAVPALPDGPNASEIMSLQRQSFDLAEALGVPLRQGRIQSSKAAAQFNTRYGIARTRDVADFYAVAHEAGGHAVEQKVGKPITDLIASNAKLLGTLDYDQALQRPEEGFAEFMALSLTNPKAAQTAHPNLYQDVRQAIGNTRPDLLHALDEAAGTYQRYLAAPSGVKVAANIVDGEKHGFVARALHQVREDGLPATIGTWLGQAYTAMVAENYPIMRSVRDLTRAIQEKQGGGLVSLPASRDPAKLIRLFGSAKNGALTQLRWGVVPYREVEAVGHSMYDAINHATGGPSVLGRLNRETTADLSSYMVAKRASNLWDRFNAGTLENPPVAFSKADAVQAMTDLLAKNPRLDEAAMMAHEFTRNMLAKQRDAGIITADLHDTLAQDPFYVPLFRDVSDKPLAGKAGGGSSQDGPGLTDTVKRLRGSSRDIIDPIQGIMMQTLLAERTIRHNDIVRSLADLGTRAGEFGNGVVEPVKAKELQGTTFDLAEQVKTVARQRGTDPNDTALLMQSLVNAFGDDPIMGTMFKMDVASKRGEPIMFYKEAGDLRAVRFSHSSEGLALYETLGSLPQAPADLYTSIMRQGTRLLRAGVVSHPTFVLANYVKDQISVGILRNDYIPLLSGLPGLWDEMRQGPASKLYAYLGGMSAGTATSGIREAENNDIAQIAKRGYGAIHLSSLEGLMELTQITEAATRNSIFAKTYKQKLKQGLSPIDAAIEGAYQGTDILDFGQHGSRMMALRAFIPFINPHIQGLNKAVATMLTPLGRLARGETLTQADKEAAANAGWALGKFAALGGTMGAILAALNWDREEYRDATPEQKAMNFIFPIGDKVYRMPKPFELGLGFTAGEYAYAKLMQDDPRAARQFMAAAWEVLKPPDPIAGNPFIKSYVETETGTSLFTGRPIVPENLQGLAPQAQYNERTSGIARKASEGSAVLAKVMNDLTGSSVDAWSPMLVDNVIGNLGGYLGKEVQINSKFLLDQVNGPEQRFEDAAFFKRFTLDPNKTSTTVQDYYGFAGQKGGAFPQAAATVQHLIDMGHKQEASDFMATLSDEQKAYATLQTAGDADGKRAFTPDERRLNPITRAQSAVKSLSDFSHEMIGNRQTNTETGEHIDMSPAQLRIVNDAVLQMAAMEMRNALVMTNDKGYQGRPILDLKPQLEAIRAASPDAADEIARRYATNRVLPTDTVARAWPDARQQILAKGSEADLADAMVDATLGGYEFGGDRVKRRGKHREVVRGNEMETAP